MALLWQLFVVGVMLAASIAVVAMCICAIVVVIRAPHMRFKPLWLLACLVGLVGVGIPLTFDDLFFIIGPSLPIITIGKVLPSGAMLIKAELPVAAIFAIYNATTAGPSG